MLLQKAKCKGWGKIGLRGGGSVRAPFLPPPPLSGLLCRGPDVLMVTPQQADRGGWAGGPLKYHNIYDSK